MKRLLRWIEDSTPSADARILALRQVSNIRKIMQRTGLQSAQKIWSDGTFFFHYKVSRHMNQIRVWSDAALIGKLRFWVIQTGIAYGIFYNGTDWDKVEIADITVLPDPGSYVWHGVSKTIIKSNSVVNPARHFMHQYPTHIPNYARSGMRLWLNLDIPLTTNDRRDLQLPITSSNINSVDRETKQVTATPFDYSPATLEAGGDPLPWCPYPGLDIVSPTNMPLSPQTSYGTGIEAYPLVFSPTVPSPAQHYFQIPAANQYRYQHFIDDAESAPIDFPGAASVGAYAFFHDDTVDFRFFYAAMPVTDMTGVGTITAAFLRYNLHDNTVPYADSVWFQTYSLGTAFSAFPVGWKTGISGSNIFDIYSDISSANSAGTQMAIYAWQVFGTIGNISPTRTPRNYKFDINHAAKTVDVTELSPQYKEDVDHNSTVVSSTPPGWAGETNSLYNGISAHEEMITLSGWSHGDDDVLYESKITYERIEAVDYTENTVYTDGGVEGGSGHDLTKITDTKISTYEWYYQIKLYMRGILVWTHTTDTRKANFDQQIVHYKYTTHTPATPTLTATINTLTSEEFVDDIAPQVIIHDIDLYSGSASITILERKDVYDDGAYTVAGGLAGDYTRTGISTEKTRVRGNDLADQIYTAVTDVVAGLAMSTGGQITAIDEGAGDYTTSVDDFTLVPGTDIYPESFGSATLETPFRFYSTGMAYRFLTDSEGNTLAYCPTGQEAYWDLDGDSADTPPAKWRLATPHVFKLYDQAGAEIDLSNLGLTDVENIGLCDRMFSSTDF